MISISDIEYFEVEFKSNRVLLLLMLMRTTPVNILKIAIVGKVPGERNSFSLRMNQLDSE